MLTFPMSARNQKLADASALIKIRRQIDRIASGHDCGDGQEECPVCMRLSHLACDADEAARAIRHEVGVK